MIRQQAQFAKRLGAETDVSELLDGQKKLLVEDGDVRCRCVLT